MNFRDKPPPGLADKYTPETLTNAFFEMQHRGKAIANAILTKAPGASLKKIQAYLERNFSLEVKNSAMLYSCVPEVATLVNNGKSIASGEKVEGVDYDKVVMFNHWLRENIKDASKSNATPQQLRGFIEMFAKTNGLIDEPHIPALKQEIETSIVGMWSEQNAENLLCTANIGNFNTSVKYDRGGIDLFVETSRQTDPTKSRWTGIDVKASVFGITREIDKEHQDQIVCIRDGQWIEFDKRMLADDSHKIPADKEHPVIYAYASESSVMVAIDTGKDKKLPDKLEAVTFSSNNESAVSSAHALQSFLGGNTHKKFVRNGDIFVQIRMPRNLGALATKN